MCIYRRVCCHYTTWLNVICVYLASITPEVSMCYLFLQLHVSSRCSKPDSACYLREFGSTLNGDGNCFYHLSSKTFSSLFNMALWMNLGYVGPVTIQTIKGLSLPILGSKMSG